MKFMKRRITRSLQETVSYDSPIYVRIQQSETSFNERDFRPTGKKKNKEKIITF